jgi:hypothetical protein
VDLRCEAAPTKASSLYKDAFCGHHERAARELGLEQNPAAYAKVGAGRGVSHAHQRLPSVLVLCAGGLFVLSVVPFACAVP